VSGINLSNAMSLNTNTLWTTAGGTDTGSSVSGLNESALRTALKNCNSNLLSFLSGNLTNPTIAQVVGGQQIVSTVGQPLPTSLPFPIFTNSTYLLVNWTNQPTNFMSSFSISFGGTNKTWFTPELEGQRISLTFSTNGLGQLWLEDSNVLQTSNTGTSNTLPVILTAQHPYGGWNSTLNVPVDTGVYDKSSTNSYQRTNSSYAIMYAFEASPQWLQERQQKLDAYRAAGLPDTSREVNTETLNVMGLGWMVQTELSQELLCQEWGQLPHHHHRFGRMGQEKSKGYYVDVYLQQDATFPSTGYGTSDQTANNQVFDVSSYIWSAMEHGIIEQLQNSNLVAASTVKMLQIANTNSQTIYMASSANWSSIRGSLINYGSTTNTLNNLISQGFVLLLPQNGSNHVAGTSTWAGNGYVQLGVSGGSRSMGMIIGGGYNGGYDSSPFATVNPTYVSFTGDNQSTFFNPQSSTFQLGTQFGADPVNLVDGSFEISVPDLSIGQSEPRGLNLTRFYSSARRNSNPAGMGPGWLHSYYCTAVPISDPQAGLGAATVQQMSPMIVATYAAINLYNNVNLDPKNWAMTALIAKWGIDQLENNTVSVNLGKDTMEFVKQPDGSFTPPANSIATLLQTNGSYWLQERHARTFKFSTTGLLTNIVDQYGQTMKFTYNSNNFVTNIVDWKGRTLTFKYSGSNLTNVSDNTGRSVSYGYTGNDLTSYTDPEQKTCSYAYDTNHDIVATYDALNRLVVTNYYDGNGHITTQLTQGDTNKTWQVMASGYQTVEIDPAGDQRIFTYDNKFRLIALQDGLGNVTRTAYDGQDHVIQTISPLGETNQFIYDGNNNIIEIIDPLGFSNVFTFDSQNRMIASTDGDGHTSHFGYNAQFSLTGSTNGNGDYFTMIYNSDGTLSNRTDSAGTTTYGYDGNGQLNSITYPNSLGGESFINNTFGDPTSHTDVRGFTTTFAYNNRRQLTNTIAPTNLTARITFDANGNLSTTTDARGFVTSNSWSVTRHLLTTTMPPTPQGSPVAASAYDSRDWLISVQNPLGKFIYYTNDAAQRLIATTDPLGRTTTFGYDNDGHKITSVDAALHQTTQAWDARGNLVRVLDAATNIVGKVYDGADNLIYLTNRNGNVWHFQYDGANRLTNAISPLNRSSSQVYNNRGLRQSSTDPMTNTTTFGYDARGRMTNKTDTVGANNYTYDGNNNLTLLTNVGKGIKLSWGFDAYNRATSFTNAAGYIIQYRYDANGNLTNLIYPGNRTVSYFFDSNNRLTNVTDWAGRQTTYAYDLAGRMTGIMRPNNTVRSMNYDDAGQLTNIVERTTSQFPISFFTLHYDPAGRTDWEFKGPLPHPFTPPTRTMTYDADNRLATFNGANVTVDADGNLTYGPLTNNTFGTYTYDVRNELTSAGGISYGYDPAGNRTSLTNGSVVTTFVVNQNSQVLMRIKNNATNYYIYGSAGLIYEIDETATTTNAAFYHFDSRGSTVVMTDSNGNPTDAIEYSAYGTTTYRTGTNDTPFCYNGAFGVMTDPNGLLFMRARYYNPYISRFINPDPSGFGGGLNFYAFADGNPISETDPFGLNGWTSAFGALRVVGGAFEVAAGVTLGAATSWTGIGAVGGGLVALHGLDQIQAGIHQAWTGNQVNSITSQGLQAAGMSPTAANLTDAGISIVGTAGASFFGASSAAGTTGQLVHLTDSAGGAAINESGTLIGNGGIYAGPLANADASGLSVTLNTGLSPGAFEAAVPIPTAAEGAFSTVQPTGIISTWQALTGQVYTQAGTLDLATGVFTQTGLNLNQLAIYGIDSGAINLSAFAGTALSSGTGK
jgi:RHS repeat-associated protein